MSEANIFIIVNLGCEMLYVIEQRLQAQNVCAEKSSQVMYDITSTLFDTKFIQRLIIGNQKTKSLITTEHCKFILNDIACCSLMRLDEISMNKLWDLVTMIFKWQISTSKQPQHLLDITFRHTDGIIKFYPEERKTLLADYAKNNILDFWNTYSDQKQQEILNTIKSWLNVFNIKVSILIRFGLQNIDGTFVENENIHEKYYHDLIKNVGENIYNKNEELIEDQECNAQEAANKICGFENQLNVKSNEQIWSDKNIIFNDLSINIDTSSNNTEQFIQLKTNYVSNMPLWNKVLNDKKDIKEFLKMKF